MLHAPASGSVATGSFVLPRESLFDPALGRLDEVSIEFRGTGGVVTTLEVEPGDYIVAEFILVELADAAGGFHVSMSDPLATKQLEVFSTGGVLVGTATGLIDVWKEGANPVQLHGGPGDQMILEGSIGPSVSHTYSPIPEPSGSLLVGLGLAGLSRRRRPGVRRADRSDPTYADRLRQPPLTRPTGSVSGPRSAAGDLEFAPPTAD